LKNCFAECFTLALGKEVFAEFFFFAVSLPRAVYRTLGKAFFAECIGFAECFLFGSRQSLLCRAPEKKRSAKPPTLGKEADSGNDTKYILTLNFFYSMYSSDKRININTKSIDASLVL
jgi:hypothetical protein